MDDDFTLRDCKVQKWLLSVALGACVLAVGVPPSFWLCGLGVVLVVVGQVAYSFRTNQWMSWQNEGSLNWFEGWAVSTGAVLAIIPLSAEIVRSWLTT